MLREQARGGSPEPAKDAIILDLTTDQLLSTTRTVRRRLDLTRPVSRELLNECLELALQAPSGGNRQDWRFVVVTEEDRRRRLGEIYRRAWDRYVKEGILAPPSRPSDPDERAQARRIGRSALHLADHMGEVPALLVPCHEGRFEGRPSLVQASLYGSILPAVWSFMLAARARGLGTAWTTLHLFHEQEVAEVLDIPYDEVTQVAMIPVAHTLGTDFRPGARGDMDVAVRWDSWEASP
ncbi:MAG: nitroreductase family protein [Miltoncostaeaceae bacterium]